uniref:Uncharacterized protein n=1 Tax=Nelumbo nucifera TaxID=4432 RepID=A0A822XWJ7_NELNU|nr:TPA_asm: hypothetical protein HUJ06_024608 [Nelumbo nucifera]
MEVVTVVQAMVGVGPTISLWSSEPPQKWMEEGRAAVSQTCFGLKDHLLNHSTELNEFDVLRRQSENDMKRCLTWCDLIWRSFGFVVDTIMHLCSHRPESSQPCRPFHELGEFIAFIVVLSYATSGISTLLSIFCYTELAVKIPIAELGEFIAFIVVGNILLENIVGAAGLTIELTTFPTIFSCV